MFIVCRYNKPLAAKTNGQREKTVHLSRFLPPTHFRFSTIFFLAFFPIAGSTPPTHRHFTTTTPGASIFSHPHANIYPPIYIFTHGRRLMMSIFHSSARANFCFSQQFTLDSPLDRTCENEIIIIVLQRAYHIHTRYNIYI